MTLLILGMEMILLSKKDVDAFYRKRHRIIKIRCSDEKIAKKLRQFLDTMPPLMLWVAYKEIPLSEHPNYDASKSILRTITQSMMEKLGVMLDKS